MVGEVRSALLSATEQTAQQLLDVLPLQLHLSTKSNCICEKARVLLPGLGRAVLGQQGALDPALAGCMTWGESDPSVVLFPGPSGEGSGVSELPELQPSAVSFVTLEGRGGDHSIRATEDVVLWAAVIFGPGAVWTSSSVVSRCLPLKEGGSLGCWSMVINCAETTL